MGMISPIPDGVGFLPPLAVPVTSLSSTVIYYIKQGAKLAWIGY